MCSVSVASSLLLWPLPPFWELISWSKNFQFWKLWALHPSFFLKVPWMCPWMKTQHFKGKGFEWRVDDFYQMLDQHNLPFFIYFPFKKPPKTFFLVVCDCLCNLLWLLEQSWPIAQGVLTTSRQSKGRSTHRCGPGFNTYRKCVEEVTQICHRLISLLRWLILAVSKWVS